MKYKVFLVEDEIITREGIRDNVNWAGAGFEFCGEASDGEMALQYIQDTKPDVVITDIKMPFMDGLQLSKFIHEQMPWVKIIILSGHDEFEYAQSAVKLGVAEYILKPISSQELHDVLLRMAEELDRERLEARQIDQLKNKIEASLTLSREKFLLDLVMGAVSSTTAIEQSQQFGMTIVAKCYLVAVMKFNYCDASQSLNYQNYLFIEQTVSEFASQNVDIYLTKIGFDLLVLFFKGETDEQLIAEGDFLLSRIAQKIRQKVECDIKYELGSPQDRLGNVHLSFLDAMLKINTPANAQAQPAFDNETFVHTDHQKIENYLKFGLIQEFDQFFEEVLQPAAEAAMQSDLMRQHLMVDLLISANQFLQDLHQANDQQNLHLANLAAIDSLLNGIHDNEQIRIKIKKMFQHVLEIRDQQTQPERAHLLYEIIAYLDQQFENAELKMNEVAEKFNLSPGYFSTVFHQAMGETFRDYVANKRIEKAKVLLRTTNHKILDIAFRCGYNDPHYFSTVFKRKTGQSPQQFRNEHTA